MRRFLAAAKPLPQIWKLGACMPGGRKKRGRLGKKLPKLPFSLQALVPMYRAWPGMVVEAVDAFFGKPWANVRIAIKLTYPKDGLQRRAAKLARLMDETREESWSPYITYEAWYGDDDEPLDTYFPAWSKLRSDLEAVANKIPDPDFPDTYMGYHKFIDTYIILNRDVRDDESVSPSGSRPPPSSDEEHDE